jgi:hypothetical protein
MSFLISSLWTWSQDHMKCKDTLEYGPYRHFYGSHKIYWHDFQVHCILTRFMNNIKHFILSVDITVCWNVVWTCTVCCWICTILDYAYTCRDINHTNELISETVFTCFLSRWKIILRRDSASFMFTSILGNEYHSRWCVLCTIYSFLSWVIESTILVTNSKILGFASVRILYLSVLYILHLFFCLENYIKDVSNNLLHDMLYHTHLSWFLSDVLHIWFLVESLENYNTHGHYNQLFDNSFYFRFNP